jgi:type I restriction enzyme S subunit
MGEIAEVIGGGTPKASDPENFFDNGYPWITPADLGSFSGMYIQRGKRSLSEKGLRLSSAQLMPRGAVLMSSRAPIGYVAIAANEISTNQGFKSFVVHKDILPEHVFYWLKFLRPQLEQFGSGSTFAEISGSRAREIPILIAPLAEQKRIAAKIEDLLGRVIATRERLAKVPTILKRFRQAVLAAACSGRLTEDLRMQNRRPSASSVRAKTNFGGLSELPEIPDTWSWQKISEIASVQGGIQKQPKRTPRNNAYPYLRVANVLRNKLDLSEIHEMELFGGELQKYRLEPDDLLIVEGNGSFSEIGRSALWTAAIENCVHQNHIIRVRAFECSAHYLNSFWNSPVGIARVAQAAVTTSGLYSLSTAKVAAVLVPVPPIDEQNEIVRRVEGLFRLSDAIEKRLAAGTRMTGELAEAILTKAFRGELVPTEAEVARREGRSYETASELLARIKDLSNPSRSRLVQQTQNHAYGSD